MWIRYEASSIFARGQRLGRGEARGNVCDDGDPRTGVRPALDRRASRLDRLRRARVGECVRRRALRWRVRILPVGRRARPWRRGSSRGSRRGDRCGWSRHRRFPRAPSRVRRRRRDADAVVELTPDNFKSEVEAPGSGRVFVEFYAPWCPFCQRLEPIWNELPSKLAAAGVSTKIARMNVDTYTDYGAAYGVTGFPPLMLFQDGRPVGRRRDSSTWRRR